MATERKIGAHVYRCDKLPAGDSLPLFLKVTKLFQAAPGMLSSFATDTKEAKAAFLTLCLSGEVEPAAMTEILTEIVGTCQVGTDPCVIGVKPQSFDDMIDVAWFGLEVQFGSFLRASLG
jgi:hypothetical protein